MREIKFRAWDELQNRMRPWQDRADVEILTDGTIRHMWPKVHLLQFTGLKDKNGKEIYEGDVVRLYSTLYCNSAYSEGVVNDPYEDHFVEYPRTSYNFGFQPFLNNGFDQVNTEIIGNIYENPDLLKP